MQKILVKTALFLLLLNCCVLYADGQETVNVKIDTGKRYQTIRNFGASDAWACQFVGSWPDEKRQKIADLLFSSDTLQNGAPAGIALSLWRFNIGAGSAGQGEESGIKDEWRRAALFSDRKGTVGGRRQAAQLWFIKAARKRGVPYFLGFCNSPPVHLTRNHRAFADSAVPNLAQDRYADFAGFLADAVQHVEKQTGVKTDYISPFNEPQWDWSDGGQEGTPFTNQGISDAIKSIDAVFTRKNTASRILVPEAGEIGYVYDTLKKAARGAQARAFFDKKSALYIGNLPHVSKTIAAHSYFTTSPAARSLAARKELFEQISEFPGLEYWQSEYCILGDNAGEINGQKRDLGIDAALYVARVIHDDLTAANASAWQWWTALSAYDYKDGLIYIDKQQDDGQFYPAKTLWALGNYSRFIRPGAIRIAADAENHADSTLRISAYRQGKSITIVVLNSGRNTRALSIGGKHHIILNRRYCTSEKEELQPSAILENEKPTVPARSVCTFTGTLR